MIIEKLGRLIFTPASYSEVENIVEVFTDRKLNFCATQRFPSDIENQLRYSLLSGLILPGRQLLTGTLSGHGPQAFLLCSKGPFPHTVFLCGVWPDYRGQGIFLSLAESLLCLCQKREQITFYSHPAMSVANRQLSKLAFYRREVNHTCLIYRADGRKA